MRYGKALRDVVIPGIVVPLLLIGVAIPQAHADETPPSGMTIRVDYRAPATCPSRDQFLANIRRYTAKWSLLETGTATRELTVVLDGPAGVARGTLEISAGERKTRRVVTGPSCEAVARALAVVVALVIDPAAAISDRQDAPPPVEVPESQPPASPPVVPEAPSSSTPIDQTSPRRVRPPAPPHRPPRAAAPSSGFSLELREELSYAVVSRPLVVLGAFADYELPSWADIGRRTGVTFLGRPSLGLGFRQSLPRSIGLPGGSTEFLWSAASAHLCPVRLRLAEGQLHVVPCIEWSTGVLRAESRGIPLAQGTSKRWFDASATVLGMWRLAGPWVATLSVSLVVPLTRYRYEAVELGSAGGALRTELVSQAPTFGMAMGLGLGLRL